MPTLVLAINGGSSSLKAAIFEAASPPRLIATARAERIGSPESSIAVTFEGRPPQRRTLPAATHDSALRAILDAFGGLVNDLRGAGHRIVHGGPDYSAPQPVTPPLLEALRRLEPFDPEHLPAQIRLIEALMQRLPGIAHVACFDTAFHHDLPTVARRLPIPRKFDAIGVRRYGFHGLSYAYLMSELGRIDPAAANGRVILAHLGNGASLAAVRNGHCIDTSMAFTPAAGIPMGTRPGDLDPGLIDYVMRTAGLTAEQFNHMVHLESGLLGISGTTADMQRLLELETTDSRAREAIAIFCYHVRKWIGAYAAALGGLDTLIFSGGIGEHGAQIRARICTDLQFLGIALDPTKNQQHAPVISSGPLAVTVRVMATNEEFMIATDVIAVGLNDRSRPSATA